VTFRLHNNATTDRLVATLGMWCDPFSIDGVARTLGFQCLCECPAPGAAHVGEFQRLHPGGVLALPWDALAMGTCSESIDCGDFPGHRSTQLFSSYRPIAPGPYHATFGIEHDVPAGCASSGDFVGCGGSFGPPNGSLPSVAAQCSTTNTVSVDFNLPLNGDITVDVAIN
jgi:hypothetical protein